MQSIVSHTLLLMYSEYYWCKNAPALLNWCTVAWKCGPHSEGSKLSFGALQVVAWVCTPWCIYRPTYRCHQEWWKREIPCVLLVVCWWKSRQIIIYAWLIIILNLVLVMFRLVGTPIFFCGRPKNKFSGSSRGREDVKREHSLLFGLNLLRARMWLRNKRSRCAGMRPPCILVASQSRMGLN